MAISHGDRDLGEIKNVIDSLCRDLQDNKTVKESFRNIEDRIKQLKAKFESNRDQINDRAQRLSEIKKQLDDALSTLMERTKMPDCISAANKDAQQLEARIAELQSRYKACMEQHLKLQEESDQLTDQATANAPNDSEYAALINDFKLYRKITNLVWTSDPDSHLLQGYVAGKNVVRPFSLDTKASSSFTITNHLWDLIDDTE